MQCRGAKSFVDDLGLSRGVVLSRAAASLRSIETKPFDWEICPLQTDTRLPLKSNALVLCPASCARLVSESGLVGPDLGLAWRGGAGRCYLFSGEVLLGCI